MAYAIIGQGVISALLPWLIGYGFGPISPTQRWWILGVAIVIVSYAMAFGIGTAIHNNQCDSRNASGRVATWAGMVPLLNAVVLLLVINVRFMRTPIETLLQRTDSDILSFAATASYYLFWSATIGATIAGYNAKIC